MRIRSEKLLQTFLQSKKLVLVPINLLLLASGVLAMGTKDGSVNWVVYKALAFIIGSFVFSGIFWYTHNAICKCKK